MKEWATPKKLPPKHHQRIIERLVCAIDDPSHKLRFIDQVFSKYSSIPSVYNLYQPLADVALYSIIVDEAELVCPGSRETVQSLFQQGTISPPSGLLWSFYRKRAIIVPFIALLLVLGICGALISFGTIATSVTHRPQPPVNSKKPATVPSVEASEPVPIVAAHRTAAPSVTDNSPEETEILEPGTSETVRPSEGDETIIPEQRDENDHGRESAAAAYLSEPIWLVEETSDSEVYSNSLRITISSQVDNIARSYCRLKRGAIQAPLEVETVHTIAGIVYHASESDIVDFIPEKNQSIIEYTERILTYIQRAKCYNYFIDRFGRVYRIVREDHAAFHAGNSVWGDDEAVYVNLNHAFIGICFEGRDFEEVKRGTQGTGTGKSAVHLVAMDSSTINDAQLRSGKELTDYLRWKYTIPEYNCVPHGLTSVNPDKMLIGYHLDLSHGFPFEHFGLTNKYQVLLPSMTDFGFTYDNYFRRVLNGKLWPGIEYSEEETIERAEANGMSVKEYRCRLSKRYSELCAVEKRTADESCSGERL